MTELIVCHDVANFTDKQLAYMSFRQAGRAHENITPLTVETCNFAYRATAYMPFVLSVVCGDKEWLCQMRDNNGFLVEASGISWQQAVMRARALATIPSGVGMEFPAWVLHA